ncbi:netrin receptor UNC5C-like [Patiria miniata]|uniref:Death domain-containing protein n=1 Tax=Patiria miniata TaxID=46514 RepID=A0A913Z1X8_PATMI|nr:netrin receptor UNC5C-like [Patiria miniata]
MDKQSKAAPSAATGSQQPTRTIANIGTVSESYKTTIVGSYNYPMQGPGVPAPGPQQTPGQEPKGEDPYQEAGARLDNKTLYEVAERLSAKWTTLAVKELGFSTVQVETIENKFQNNYVRQGLDMLVSWKQRQSSSDEQKMTTLCTALKKIGREDIAKFLPEVPAPRPQHSQRPDQEPRLEAPSYQEAGNKTGDSLKHETSQDTEVPRSPEPSHLQKVLDEVNKLKKNLSPREQLDSRVQLPYIAIGYFNEKGGSLSLDEYGVHLTIPRGAIALGPPQQVYIYVDPTAPQKGAVESTVVSLSPTVKCGPEGLRFKESVVLSFPHHAVLVGQTYDNLGVRMRHDDLQDRQREDGNPALVTEKEVFVLADHFTNFDLVGTPTHGSSIRMKVAAFGGVLGVRCRQYAFRVHVWNDDTNVEQYVIREEEQRMNSKMLDVSRKILFVWDSGNLAVRVSDLNGGWTFWGAREEVGHR